MKKKKTIKCAFIDWMLFVGVNVLYLSLLWFIFYKSIFSSNSGLFLCGLFYSICLMIIYHAFFVEGTITLSPKRAFFPEKKRIFFHKSNNRFLLIFLIYVIPMLLTGILALLYLYWNK